MRCIFFQIEPYEQDILDVIETYFEKSRIKIDYIVVEEEMEFKNALTGECNVFYLLANGLPKRWSPYTRLIALCRNYEEGIQALEDGSDYALQIPINREKMIRCCEYLNHRSSNQEVLL